MNTLNITSTNFGNDATKRFLGDVTVSIRLHGDTSPTFHAIGYCDPEKTFSSKRDYAEFVSGMPEVVIAKDLTKITYSFKAKLKQFQAETFALATGALIDDSATNPRVLFGTLPPSSLECSMILSGETKDGKSMELYIRKAQITPETIEIALGSKEYGAIAFECNIAADDHPHVTNWDWPVLGEIISTAGTIHGSTYTIHSNKTTSLAVGMQAYTEKSGFLGIIEDFTTLSPVGITLDRISGSTETSGTIKFVSQENLTLDNIAFMEFEGTTEA